MAGCKIVSDGSSRIQTARTIAAVLIDSDKGIRAAIMAAKGTGKKARLTLTVDVVPDKTDENLCEFVLDVVTKIPRMPYAKGLMFVTANGDASREDPRQHELELERQEKLKDQGVTALAQIGRG